MHSADEGLGRPVEAISDGLDLTSRVRRHFIRTNATGKRCFSTA
jgi:hypothetical protein